MNEEEICNTTLGLGIGVGIKRENQSKNNKMGFWLDLSLPIHPKIEVSDHDHKNDDDKDDQDSLGSKTTDDQNIDAIRLKRSINDTNVCDNNSDGSRKKLKLTTEQTTLLEDSFKIHSTLNTGQKQELAKTLNLLPRQIEVWFQNRRARTKLKQIEQECKLLKKCCETLNEENRRLKKELQEARSSCSLKFDHLHGGTPARLPFYIRYPTTVAIVKSGEETKPLAIVNGGSMQTHDKKNASGAN